MAGSYNHAVDTTTGKLLNPDDMPKMVENLGDAYETIEEMYGMIWFLATALQARVPAASTADMVEAARQAYREGIAASPGTDGELGDDE